jgi:hypothetical protein
MKNDLPVIVIGRFIYNGNVIDLIPCKGGREKRKDIKT